MFLFFFFYINITACYKRLKLKEPILLPLSPKLMRMRNIFERVSVAHVIRITDLHRIFPGSS